MIFIKFSSIPIPEKSMNSVFLSHGCVWTNYVEAGTYNQDKLIDQ